MHRHCDDPLICKGKSNALSAGVAPVVPRQDKGSQFSQPVGDGPAHWGAHTVNSAANTVPLFHHYTHAVVVHLQQQEYSRSMPKTESPVETQNEQK